jgi:hypothetical protein
MTYRIAGETVTRRSTFDSTLQASEFMWTTNWIGQKPDVFGLKPNA